MRRIIALAVTLLFLFVVLPVIFPPVRQRFRALALMMRRPPKSLPIPVSGVGPRDLVDTWGAAREGGRRHEGIDIFARRNTPVHSATEGVVSKVGWNTLGGRVVVVMGPGGNHHYYAHLEKFGQLDVGAWIDSGTVIGYVGNTGNARTTPPHLHYGIYTLSGQALDPYPFLVGARPAGPSAPRSGAARRAR
jgi:murein DD-endopeptidase MepM/ murein hydrolase activator NlpD